VNTNANIQKQYIFTDEMTVNISNGTNYTIFFAHAYEHTNLSITNSLGINQYTNFSNVTTEFSPIYQILQYNIVSGETSENTLISVESNETVVWQIQIGERVQFTPYQLFLIPLDMILLHGYYWSKTFYDWIFFLITFGMAVLTNSLETKKNTTFFNSLLLYSCAGFLASAGSKLYHTIAASLTSNVFDQTFIFTITVVCLCIELGPIILASLLYYIVGTSKNIPSFSISISILTSFGILFLGSGYFVGPFFLCISCIFKLFQKYVCFF